MIDNAEPAFTQLSEANQKVCVEIAIAISLLAGRIPTFKSKTLNLMSEKWAGELGLSSALVHRALLETGQTLFDTNWEFSVTKKGPTLVSQFRHHHPMPNGEESVP
jgi:hypothetical protein